jgi:hypothetical protein
MQADPIADQLRREPVALDHLPDALVYELQLSTGLAGFAKSAAKDGVIEPVGEDGTTTYRLR